MCRTVPALLKPRPLPFLSVWNLQETGLARSRLFFFLMCSSRPLVDLRRKGPRLRTGITSRIRERQAPSLDAQALLLARGKLPRMRARASIATELRPGSVWPCLKPPSQEVIYATMLQYYLLHLYLCSPASGSQRAKVMDW